VLADPVALLRRHLGYPGFRPGQEELVRSVLHGKDALGILPTGGGKSVCYQVPALALRAPAGPSGGALTLVVTPLISLMEDQVGRAREIGLRAERLSAGQPASERRSISRAAVRGQLDILFVAPERLETPAFQEVLDGARIGLVAVDEAHCISEWGHDFRPAYRRIAVVRGRLAAPFLALTASATPAVRADIADNLGLHDPTLVVRSFDRPNLSWIVRPVPRGASRLALVRSLLRAHPGTALVYAPTRRSVDGVRDALARLGLVVEAYHAGLAPEERTRVQARFLGGECRVVVATNAFGMGIDKPDVRLVAHLQLPGTLEAYYQEAGRAGRDGDPSVCVALHARGDDALARGFLDRTHPPLRRLRRLHRWLGRRRDRSGRVGTTLASVRAGLDPPGDAAEAATLLRALARARGIHALGPLPDPESLAEVGTGAGPPGSQSLTLGWRSAPKYAPIRRLRRRSQDKIRAVTRYARSRHCRRRSLLAYFGERAKARCGSCDRCRRGLRRHDSDDPSDPWTDT